MDWKVSAIGLMLMLNFVSGAEPAQYDSCENLQYQVMSLQEQIAQMRDTQTQFFFTQNQRMDALETTIGSDLNMSLTTGLDTKFEVYGNRVITEVDNKMSPQTIVPPIFLASLFSFACGMALAYWRMSR